MLMKRRTEHRNTHTGTKRNNNQNKKHSFLRGIWHVNPLARRFQMQPILSDDCDRPQDVFTCVTIQFPDPPFNASYAKRRVVTPELVKAFARIYSMPSDAKIFLQSDVQTIMDEIMRVQLFGKYK